MCFFPTLSNNLNSDFIPKSFALILPIFGIILLHDKKKEVTKSSHALDTLLMDCRECKKSRKSISVSEIPPEKKRKFFLWKFAVFPYMIDGLNANCFDFSQFTFFSRSVYGMENFVSLRCVQKKEERKKSFKNYTVIIRKREK